MGDDKPIDTDRYESAEGFEPRDPYKKQRERARKEWARFDQVSEPILQTADRKQPHEPAHDLFRSLWRTGEVAVLFGEPGVGKSVFAFRLAASIASARPLDGIEDGPARTPRRVALIDLQRTDAQWRQRFAGKRLPSRLTRHHFDWDAVGGSGETDDIRAARVNNSIARLVERDGVEVVILDDLSLVGINARRPAGALRTLRTLKLLAAAEGVSILAVANARPRASLRPASLSDIAYRHVGELADSAFCLSASTLGRHFRYIRHMRSSTAPLEHDASNVLSLLIGTPAELDAVSLQFGLDPPKTPLRLIGIESADEHDSNSPPARGGVAEGRGGGRAGVVGADGNCDDPSDSSHCPLSTVHCSLEPHLRFLGTAAESVHVRDYAREVRLRAEEAARFERRLELADKHYVKRLRSEGRLIDAPDLE